MTLALLPSAKAGGKHVAIAVAETKESKAMLPQTTKWVFLLMLCKFFCDAHSFDAILHQCALLCDVGTKAQLTTYYPITAQREDPRILVSRAKYARSYGSKCKSAEAEVQQGRRGGPQEGVSPI